MRKKNYKGRCEKLSISKSKEVLAYFMNTRQNQFVSME